MKDPASIIRDAAAWARENRNGLGYDETAPVLDALADSVERGDVDAGDLSESGWSSVMVWADRHGIATIAP